MWRKLSPLTKEELAGLRGLKKVRLYADEDIEEEVVELFRDKGVNVTSARELGYRGKPDSFHAGYAFKEKRFIITKNAGDFLDDRKLPFTRVHGVIVIEGNMGDTEAYVRSFLQVLELIPYGSIYEGMKICVTPNEISFKFINSDGKLTNQRIKNERGELYEWVDIA